MSKLLTNRNFYSVLLAVVISFTFVAVMVSGATTISTNITTSGTLAVTGDSTFTGDVFATSTLAVTGQAVFFDQLGLDQAATDPTGDREGALYWDTARRVIRVYNGTDWMSVASSTDASGGLILSSDANGVRFNTIASAYMTLGTTTVPITAPFSGNAVLLLNSTTTASVPLAIMGSKGSAQTGDLVVVYDETQEVFAIDSGGNASSTMLSTTGVVVDALVVSGYATTSGSTGNFDTEGSIVAAGSLTMTGATVLNGAVTLGDADGDALIFTGNASTTNSLSVATRGVGEFSLGGYATTTVFGTMATTTLGASDVLGSAFGIATTSPSFVGTNLGVTGSIHAGNTVGTTSLILHSDAANTGTCIQMRTSDGVIVRIYATTTPVAASVSDGFLGLVVEAGYCTGTY